MLLTQQSQVNKHASYFRTIVRENKLLIDLGLYACLAGIVIISYKKAKDLEALPGLFIVFRSLLAIR